MVKKIFIGIGLCNTMTYVFKGHVKIVKIYLVILNRLKIILFLQIQSVHKHKHNVVFNKTVTKLVTILTKCFFPYLSPISHLKLTNRLSTLLRFKDVILKELQSPIVYKFSCGNCNVTHYGKTKRHLNIVCSENLGITHLTGKRVECQPYAVLDHFLLHNHDSDFHNFTILCQDNDSFRVLSKESILIFRDSPVLNKNTAPIPLFLFD